MDLEAYVRQMVLDVLAEQQRDDDGYLNAEDAARFLGLSETPWHAGLPPYKQTLAGNTAGRIADAAQTAAGILRALVQRAIVPDLTAVSQKLGLSPATLDFTSKNVHLGRASTLAPQATKPGVSPEAQLEHQHQQALGQIKDALAARGLVQRVRDRSSE